MTRKKLWLLNMIGVGSFALALAMINPALAAAPIGFLVLWAPLLAGLLWLQWAVSARHLALRVLAVAVSGLLAFQAIGLAGGPVAGLIALVLWVLTAASIPGSSKLPQTKELAK